MVSVLGIFMAEVATGKDAIEQFGLAALRPVEAAAGPQRRASFAFTGSSRALATVRRGCPSAATATVDAEAPPPPPPFSPAEQLGVTQPLGYFDPLGFCKVGDEAGFHKLRCAEIKHGRVAMLAAVGTVFQHFVKFPGFEKTPAGLGALTQPASFIRFLLVLALAGFLEK